ncbi:OprD family porin [Sulfurimonas sediminis]|uniref:OprD family porin n=1 Tax=Sulfurimonas sediminis TaxID=2590020 RepID=A0A7M1B4X6_9BACT|nr:OprD family outer membrane porin [Sulfurimonas sediminis]QOP43778.1 OprD family porin [Sulfurimonas sediminis]
MKILKLSAIAALACVFSVSVEADESTQKRELKNNMMVKTNIVPGKVDNLADMFTEGMFYGRLRTNYFKWDWKNDDTATTGNKDNEAFGLGGSLLYKSATYNGMSAMAGFYFTSSPIRSLREDEADIKYVKAGKDTFSRYQISTTGVWEYAVLAEANIQYEISKTKVIAGRQIFESFLTKSNDTKMIPNTFEAVVLETKELSKTRIRGAYITAQKLRDHTTFHDVITFKDESGNSWANNDDSAVHKGLSYQNFVTAGEDVNHELIVIDLRNKSIKNLKIDVTYGSVPGVVSSMTGELNYKIALPGGYSLTPGARYMKQFDNGGGAVGGATLKGSLALDKTPTSNLGYKDRFTLDSSLWMARLVLKKGALKAQVAYSAVEDAADIVAPWRGFPTGGYTRAMAQYNWYANTKTTAAEVHYDFDKAGLVPGFSTLFRYAMQNFDEAKQLAGVQADSNILHVDLRENFGNGLYAKIRVGLVSADSRVSGIEKDSYNEYRFELNYLF